VYAEENDHPVQLVLLHSGVGSKQGL